MDSRRLALVALAPIALLTFAAHASAQDAGTAEAEAIVKRYLDLHNRHRLNEVMDLYRNDAVFVLSGGKEPVVGREAIRELERFDVYANSTVQPYGLFVKINGERHYLWRAVDHEGDLLESYVTKTRINPQLWPS